MRKPTTIRRIQLFMLAMFVIATSPFSEKAVEAQVPPSQRVSGAKQSSSYPQITLNCLTVPLIAGTMASRHMSFKEVDEEILRRVAELELKTLDPTKILLTQKEYDKHSKQVQNIVKEVEQRDCSQLFAMHKKRVEWQKELEKDVRKILKSKSFKVSRKTKIELDAEKRVRPKNKKEQRVLRDKVLQLQMANLMAGGIKEAEAKEKLIHRYELATKRVEEISTEELLGSLLNAYALALDPHSLYFSPDDLEDFKIQMGLSLTGIGATLQSRDGFTVVKELSPGGPAELQGELKTGDKIVAVSEGKNGDPVDIIDMNLKDVVKKIRGDKGTWVVLTVLRPGKDVKRLQIAIQRDKIDLKDQAAKMTYHTMKRGKKDIKVALLDLPSFYAGQAPDGRDSAKDVKELLIEANAKGADALVIDLSRNGGGSLQSAIDIVGEFVKTAAVVGVGDGTSKPQVMHDQNTEINWTKPVALLTSTLSASASEILAGALKDYKRAIIVGDKRTYGKGTVQQLMPLPGDLGVIKVTTSKFFLPGGNSTQQLGVTSDLIVPSPFSYLDIGENQEDYALPAGNVPSFVSEPDKIGTTWIPVDSSKFAELSKRSKARMNKEKTFIDLEKKKSTDKDGTTITIAEILDDPKSAEDEDVTSNGSEELSPQAKETMNIIADYLELNHFKLTNQPKKVKTKKKRSTQKIVSHSR